MTTVSSMAKLFQKIIKKLKTVSDVTKYVGSGNNARIYPSHISTIQDVQYPAISVHAFSSPGKAITEGGMEIIDIQIDFWFSHVGENANTWDDLMECHAAVLNELHNNSGFDTSISANIFQIKNMSQGPQMLEPDTRLMHFPTRYRCNIIAES